VNGILAAPVNAAPVNAAPVDAGGAVSDLLRTVLLFLPKAIGFVVILVVGWLIARFLLKIVDRVLERVGFDKAVERGGIRTALARSKYDASDIVARLVYYAVLLFTLQLAFGIWGPNPVSDLIKGVVAWLPKAFVAMLIVVVAAAIASAVRDLVGNALGGLSYGRLLGNAASWFIIGIGVIAALNQIGVATTVTTPILIAVLATIAGILIVGVGGGLVRPMQRRWDAWLDRAATESQVIAEHAKAYSAGQEDARSAMAPEPLQEPAPEPEPVPAPVGDRHDDTRIDARPESAAESTQAVFTTGQAAYPPEPPRQQPIAEQPTQVLPPTTGDRQLPDDH
jgi:hypothetical protein